MSIRQLCILLGGIARNTRTQITTRIKLLCVPVIIMSRGRGTGEGDSWTLEGCTCHSGIVADDGIREVNNGP